MEKIPQIIHYCWFGGKKIPEQFNKYIATWEKILPDYEIVRWDETNFNLNECSYVYEAYHSKKFAFVSDYVRAKVLYQYGGIYLDTDIEMVKPPTQYFYEYTLILGCELENTITTGFIAAEKESKFIKEILDVYNNRKFIKANGSYDVTPNTVLFTEAALKYGFVGGNEFQVLKNKIAIYPNEFFCAFDFGNQSFKISELTATIHHYAGSWESWHYKFVSKIKIKLSKVIGVKRYQDMKKKYKRICSFFKRVNNGDTI